MNELESHRTMRMLFLANDKFPPFRVDITELFGAEMVARRGHRIDWLMQSGVTCDRPFNTNWEGGPVYVGAMDRASGFKHKLRRQLGSLLLDLRLLRARRADGYDIIQVKDKFFGALLALFCARRIGAKMCFWLSFPFPELLIYRAAEGHAAYPLLNRIRGHLLKFILYRLILRYADHVFVQSDQMKRDMVAAGAEPERITPVPMGVSWRRVEDIERESKPIPNAVPTILYLGTLVRDRKLDFLVRVLAKVRQRVTDAQIVFVGDGEVPGDRACLEREAVRCGLPEAALAFTGFLPLREAWKYVLKAHVCVSPFYPTPILWSTSPTKVIDYLALGRPVVANNHPDQRAVLEASGAGISVAFDEAAFAEAIVELLEDRSKAESMAARGPEWVRRNRSYDVIAERVEASYLELLGRSECGRRNPSAGWKATAVSSVARAEAVQSEPRAEQFGDSA